MHVNICNGSSAAAPAAAASNTGSSGSSGPAWRLVRQQWALHRPRRRRSGGGTCGVWQRRRQRWVWRQHWQRWVCRMPRMVLGHAATAVIALQHRHVAVACVVVWAWHVGGLEKTVCGHAMHTPGTHQAHAGQAHIMHMACTYHAHTGHAHTMLMAHMGAPQTPPQNKCHSATKPQSLLATGGARPLGPMAPGCRALRLRSAEA